MDRDFRDFLDMPDPGVKRVKRRRGYSRFGWTVALLLLTGGVLASWIGSIYIFNHPEDADCYQMLKKWNRIEPLKRFEVTAAPQGKFFSAQELYDVFLVMSPSDFEAKNDELLRNYLRNYSEMREPVPYLYGRFTTKGVYELTKSDVFPTGMVAVANSADCPQVTIEHIYPTASENVARARQMLAVDPEIPLEKSLSLATIVHVTKLGDDRMLFTVVPLDYGRYAYKQGISSTFRLDPPESMNIEAGFPVVKPSAMDEAVKTFALYRKNRDMLAKAQMLTLPPAASPQQAAANRTALGAQGLPPEATQPYHPPVIAELAPENSDTTDHSPVTPPSEMPLSSDDTKAAAQTLEARAEIAHSAPPVVAPNLPAVTTAVRPVSVATAPHISAVAPAIAKTAPVATVQPPPPEAVPPRAPTIVKQDKTPVKTVAVPLSTPAPVARPIARVLPSPTPAPASPKPSEVAGLFQHSARPAPAAQLMERQAPFPSPTPVEYAQAVPPANTPNSTKLDPFLSPPVQIPDPQPPRRPETIAPARASSWTTYSPGMMPRGRLISTNQAPQLADYGIGSERLYIDGRFIVTATSEARAVLRPVNYNGAFTGATIRVVVEYPGGARIPAEGAQVARGTMRPFQVVDIRRGSDGQVNIYAREVTVPESQANSAAPYNRYRVVQQSYSGVY